MSSEAFGGRTDLALETQERMKQKKMDLRGVRFEEKKQDNGIIVSLVSIETENAVKAAGLVLYDAHLRIHIVLHAVVVAVEVVGGDVEQDGDVGTEVVHVVKLERAEFDDVVFVWVFCHLKGKRVADVTRQTSVVTCLLEDVVDERRGGGLAVAARDTDHLG